MATKIDKVKMYGGEVELEFHDGYKVHKYVYEGRVVPGISTVAERVGDTEWMIPWAKKMVREYWEEMVGASLSAWKKWTNADRMKTPMLDEIQIGALYKKSWWATESSATDIGTLVHKWAEETIQGKSPEMPSNPQAANACRAFSRWAVEVNLRPVHSERYVFSRKYEFAGTLDIVALVHGNPSVIDIKVAAGIRDEYLAQAAAYQFAFNEEQEVDPSSLGEPVTHRYIVRCGKEDAQVEVAERGPDEYIFDLKPFIGALAIEQFKHKLTDDKLKTYYLERVEAITQKKGRKKNGEA